MTVSGRSSVLWLPLDKIFLRKEIIPQGGPRFAPRRPDALRQGARTVMRLAESGGYPPGDPGDKE